MEGWRYCCELNVPKLTVREELRKVLYAKLIDGTFVDTGEEIVSAINRLMFENVKVIPKEPKSVYEELSRVICGKETIIKFGELIGKPKAFIDGVAFNETCNELRAILTDFILCNMVASCRECASVLNNLLNKRIKHKLVSSLKIIVYCNEHPRLRFCLEVM